MKLPYRIYLLIASLLALTNFSSYSQTDYPEVEASPFDFGKMWTFEHPPLDYFQETYGFRPSAEWLEKARLGSLKFSTYCSASFISPDGLILTNYHCSHGEAISVQKEGEDVEANGFYAPKREEERKVPGLFVRQLVKLEDITAFIKGYTDLATTDEQWKQQRQAAFEMVQKEYAGKAGWQGLELEVVTYYNGGKYSLYGYKRYDDIRLVFIPEFSVGLYGGDPDNFTYPRYNLDFTIWRVYENGQPVNSSGHYFRLNPDDIEEGSPVFLVGNPAQTERYRTLAQLEYDRDYRYKVFLDRLKTRLDILNELNEKTPSPALNEQIVTIANSVKAIGGIVAGMHDPVLMGKKAAIEREVRSKSKAVKAGNDYWKQLAEETAKLEDFTMEASLLNPSPLGGNTMVLAHQVYQYIELLDREAGEEELDKKRTAILTLAAGLNDPLEKQSLTALLGQLQTYADRDDKYVGKLLDGDSPEEAARKILEKTAFTDPDKLEKLLTKKTKKLEKGKDPIADFALLTVPEYNKAVEVFKGNQARRESLAEKIGTEIFQQYGLSIPPDATFTLRLADGVVKRYEYNGTIAPYKTTFYGLYDRFYSNDGQKPWDLPQRYLKPNAELLKSPLNFISTNDSIGGNSGSPILNQKGELVGLLFDGNIESLTGNFIYDTSMNRSVCVHLGGIVAVLKYVYNAKELLQEMNVK